jgi:hypothetical protein
MGRNIPKMTPIPDWTLNYQRWEILRINPWYVGERWVVLEYEKYYREPSKNIVSLQKQKQMNLLC